MEELTLKERILLLGLLPREGNFVILKIVRDLQNKLSLTEEEHKEFEIKQTENQIYWNEKGNQPKPIEIGDKAKEIIKDCILELDKQKKLKQDHMELYQKFVGE